MARFYGEVQGSARTTASRTGTKSSGIYAHIRGWDIGASVRLIVNEDGDDEIVIGITGGSNKPKTKEVVYRDSKGKKQTLKIGDELRLVLKDTKIDLDFDS